MEKVKLPREQCLNCGESFIPWKKQSIMCCSVECVRKYMKESKEGEFNPYVD